MLVSVDVDRIWWQLRVKLDEYLEVAEEEVNAFQKSIDDMASFQGVAVGASFRAPRRLRHGVFEPYFELQPQRLAAFGSLSCHKACR